MKKSVFLVLALSFISILAFSQKPNGRVWKENVWQTGVTNVSSVTASNGAFFVVAKSHKGIIQIHKMQEGASKDTKTTSTAGVSLKKMSEKSGFKTGTWAVKAYNVGSSMYVFIS